VTSLEWLINELKKSNTFNQIMHELGQHSCSKNKNIIAKSKAMYKEEIESTPIKCSKTKVDLNLGDYVQNERGQCGYLAWDDCFNRYLIRSATGGNVYASTYTKIEELHENTCNTIGTECRRNHLKKKW